MALSANAIAQKLTALLATEQVSPYDAWPPEWQAQFQVACQGDVKNIVLVSPQTVAELSEVMTLAHRDRWRVLVTGQGTKLGWGALVKAMDVVISTRRLNRLIDHAVGDMTVTAEAGLSFAALQALLAHQNQWIPLDPSHATQATLGGIVAARDTGALRHRYGGVRDLCLGLTFVRADGQVAKAGGRVVKNVAGYDLMKLFTGSFGTLGIVTELTLRAYPLPECAGTVLVRGAAMAISAFAQALLRSTLTPTAVDVLVSSLPASIWLAIRFQSLSESVLSQIERVKAMAQSENLTVEVLRDTAEPQWWVQTAAALQAHSDDALCQIGVLPTLVVSSLVALQQSVTETSVTLQGRIHAASGLGQLRLVGAEADYKAVLQTLRSHCEQAGGYLSVLEAPAAVKQHIDLWGYSGTALAAMRKLKERFDPQGILNPGRFVGGI